MLCLDARNDTDQAEPDDNPLTDGAPCLLRA
jgi:hypothetical protein